MKVLPANTMGVSRHSHRSAGRPGPQRPQMQAPRAELSHAPLRSNVLRSGTSRAPISSRVQRQSAFTLVESAVALTIAAIMLTSLYGAFLSGSCTLGLSRERLRATQVMLTRLEGIRLCSFEQLTNPTYNPRTFTEIFDPKDQSSGKGGVTYTGTFTPSVPPVGSFPESYRTNMLLLEVTVSWNSGKTVQTASMQTYAAKEGIENYVKLGR